MTSGLALTSQLELLAPRGGARRLLVLGGAAGLDTQSAGDDGPCELIVVLPDLTQASDEKWLAGAARTVAAELDPSGLVYALVAPRSRGRLGVLLERTGLELGPSFLHVPSVEGARHIVPLQAGAAPYAFSWLVSLGRWKRMAGAAVLNGPGLALLARLLPPVGFTASRPGGPAPFAWLAELCGGNPSTAVVGMPAAGGRDSVLLHVFEQAGDRPAAVLKVALSDAASARLEREAGALAEIGPGAREAGARVPEGSLSSSPAGRRILAEPSLQGRPAAQVLVHSPRRAGLVLERIARWLASWQQATAERRLLTRSYLEEVVLAPASLLVPHLRGGSGYAAYLHDLCRRVEGLSAPAVAAHQDLTMANVLLEERQPLGIVDWEQARSDALPLVDLFYAVADAAAATAGYADRARSLDACFRDGSSEPGRSLVRTLASELSLEPPIVELCFHACWLHHAANEQRFPQPGMPFLALLERVTLGRFCLT